MIKGYIYGLTDPKTNEIRYIGRTVSPLPFRLMHHISETRWYKTRKFKTTHKQYEPKRKRITKSLMWVF